MLAQLYTLLGALVPLAIFAFIIGGFIARVVHAAKKFDQSARVKKLPLPWNVPVQQAPAPAEEKLRPIRVPPRNNAVQALPQQPVASLYIGGSLEGAIEDPHADRIQVRSQALPGSVNAGARQQKGPRYNAGQLQRALVFKEILDKPLALRKKG